VCGCIIQKISLPGITKLRANTVADKINANSDISDGLNFSSCNASILKKYMSRLVNFEKKLWNVKNVRTVLETNPTEQSLTVQTNNYARVPQ